MNNKILLISVALLTVGLGGCLVSKKPLFPSGHLVTQTPLKPGWYFKHTVEVSKGTHSIGVDDRTVLLAKNGQSYETYVNGSNSPNKIFQLFGSNPNDSSMIAQSKEDKDLWGYARVALFDKHRDVFMVTDHKCGKTGGNLDPVEFELLKQKGMKAENALCLFNDPALVSAAALMDKNWLNADFDIYTKIPNEYLVDIRNIKDGPLTIDQCNNEMAILSIDERLGGTRTIQGIRRHVIGASKDHLVVIEAKDNLFGNWAYILTRTGKGMNAYCKPDRIIKLAAVLPEKSKYNTKANQDPDYIRAQCSKIPNEECGTVESLISRFGGQILAQGVDVINLPKGNQAYGMKLTIMGNGGVGGIVVLATESGITRVLARFD